MTDYKTLSDSELTEALNFHRRQRNMSRGINEAAHMRQTQVVRLLESEESRRLNEEKPNHYIVSKRKNGEYGVSQDTGNNVWDHSYHHGTHKTVDAAKAWAAKHAGKYPHKIEVHEEVKQIDENEDWMNDRLSGKYKNNHGSGGTAEVSKHPKKGYWYLKHSDGHNHDVPVNTRHLRSYIKRGWLVKEEVELDEAVSVDKKNYSWGKMITVRHGSSHSFPLHPEHQEKIKNLKDGESTAFRDETGSHVTAHREGDKVHLKLRGANQKTTVAHSHFTEEVEQIDELSKKTLGSYVKKASTDQYLKGQAVQYHTNKANDGPKTFEKETRKKHMNAADAALRKASNRDTGIGRAVERLTKEEVEQIDEISTELKKRYVEKGADDVVDRFTSRGKYERPRDPSKYTKTGRPKKSAVNSPESVKYRAKLDNRRDIVNKVSQEVHGKKRFGEEVEINEASDLRITKVYNKWPKPATYAVHNADRSYHKEFDSMEAAQAHKAEKSK